jgi:hypothetical protein
MCASRRFKSLIPVVRPGTMFGLANRLQCAIEFAG